jgi:glycosyltransferase involved in cell wall biosynthesis
LVVANSPKTARELESALGVPLSRVVVVPFGSDPRPSLRTDRNWNGRLGFIGALGWDRNKGLDTALSALKRLVDQGHSEMTLSVAGPGASAPWSAHAASLGLGRRVRFLGLVHDVPRLLSELDLILSPVRYEAYGLAVQEALVAGVPTLVSARAGIAELLSQRAPPFVVVDHEDPAAWEAAVSRVKGNYRSFVEATDRVGAEFASRSWDEMAHELVAAVETRT